MDESAQRTLNVLLVAMNYAPERSGTAPYTAGWAEHMARTHRVTVLAGVPHYPEWRIHPGFGGWRSVSIERGVVVVRLRHVVPSRTSAPQRLAHETSFTARVLADRVARVRPDVVLAVSPPLFGAAAAAVVARRHRVPFGVVVQDLYGTGIRELGGGGGRSASAMDRMEGSLLRSADRVLTIHDRFRNQLVDRLGVDADRVSVVGNWAQVGEATGDRALRRAELGWGDETVVLHAGNMGAKQGLETMVDAARHADSEFAPIRYVLLGDGNQRAVLQARAAGVERLQFLPPADDATYADLLQAADVLMVCEKPGVAEMSLPSKLTSYCAAGRPVLASTGERGGTASVVAASGAGVVVPPGDPLAVHKAVLALAADPSGSAAMGDRGRAYARRDLAAVDSMARYDDWLDDLVRTRPTG